MNAIVVRDTSAMVETMLQKYVEAYNTGDLDGLMELYTGDATFFPWIGHIKKGKQEIRITLEMIQGVLITMEAQSLQVEECGDRPLNIGTFTFMNNQGEKLVSGNYLIVFKLEQDSWKIDIHATNKHNVEMGFM